MLKNVLYITFYVFKCIFNKSYDFKYLRQLQGIKNLYKVRN